MRKSLVLASVAAFGIASSAMAAEDTLNHTYIQADYLKTNVGEGALGVGLDGDGFGVQGSIRITSRFHGFLEYQTNDLDIDDSDVSIGIDLMQVGFGVNWPVGPAAELIGRAAYIKGESTVEEPGEPDEDIFDENGIAVQTGVRVRLIDRFELEGLAQYRTFQNDEDADIDLDGVSMRIYGRYNFTEMFTGALGVETDGDVTSWMAGFRVNLPW